jgi:hypothetical protein
MNQEDADKILTDNGFKYEGSRKNNTFVRDEDGKAKLGRPYLKDRWNNSNDPVLPLIHAWFKDSEFHFSVDNSTKFHGELENADDLNTMIRILKV